MAPKRKAKKELEEPLSDDGDYSEEEAPKPKKKRTPAKKKAAAEPFVDEHGWNVVPPSLLWKEFGEPEPSEKIAAFDLDQTLINRKSQAQFPQNKEDWRWFNKKVKSHLAELADDGYKIVIFSNQGGIKTALTGKAATKLKEMLQLIHEDCAEDFAFQIFVAPGMAEGDPNRKPATGMWDFFVAHANGGVKPDLKESFFVGDADGSALAHSDSDLQFARNVGLDFKKPEDVFGAMEGKGRVDSGAIKAAQAGVDDGSNPNTDLIIALRDLADELEELKPTCDDPQKMQFRILAFRAAADSLATFPDKISSANLSQVKKLPKVGKSTIERIKCFLESGTVKKPEELAASPAAGAKTKAATPSKAQKEALVFM